MWAMTQRDSLVSQLLQQAVYGSCMSVGSRGWKVAPIKIGIE